MSEEKEIECKRKIVELQEEIGGLSMKEYMNGAGLWMAILSLWRVYKSNETLLLRLHVSS
jgi:hypothetical protein